MFPHAGVVVCAVAAVAGGDFVAGRWPWKPEPWRPQAAAARWAAAAVAAGMVILSEMMMVKLMKETEESLGAAGDPQHMSGAGGGRGGQPQWSPALVARYRAHCQR